MKKLILCVLFAVAATSCTPADGTHKPMANWCKNSPACTCSSPRCLSQDDSRL